MFEGITQMRIELLYGHLYVFSEPVLGDTSTLWNL